MRTGDATLIHDHLAYLAQRGRRPRTIEARRDAVNRFARWTGRPLREATREELQGYIDAAAAPATKRVYLCHLRGFYGWAVDEGHFPADPTRRVYAPLLPRALPRPISETDLARALATAPALVRAWLMLSAFAGLRACEIGPVRGEHVIRHGAPVLLIPEAKGGGEATVPIAPVLLAELEQWPAYGWAWKPDGPYHPIAVSRRVNQHLHQLGIAANLHACRHRFGTQTYIASGRDLRLTQELLRHASPATTAVYTAFDPREASDVVSRLPTLGA